MSTTDGSSNNCRRQRHHLSSIKLRVFKITNFCINFLGFLYCSPLRHQQSNRMGVVLALAEPPFERGLMTVHQLSCEVSRLKRLTTRRIATTDMLNKHLQDWNLVIKVTTRQVVTCSIPFGWTVGESIVAPASPIYAYGSFCCRTQLA
jgi:hypothetical protein